MAQRYAKFSEMGLYQAYHFTAPQADTPLDASTHGHFLHAITVNTLGTGLVITVGNGSTATGGNVIAVITPTTPHTFVYRCVCDRGLHLALAGSGFDVTVTALPEAV